MARVPDPYRVLVSAAHKSSGKTTISVGLCATLHGRGLTVQPFKKGPDYIDPMWLTLATGRRCRQLDPYLSNAAEYRSTFLRHAADADVALVEGNHGLHDGVALDGSNSNAAVAKTLGLPVILVIDTRGMTRGIAPLILGYQAFDRDVRIAGVILNKVGGVRHEAKLRLVIEHYTDAAVLGAVHCDPRLAIVERHLGLMPSNEADGAAERVAAIASIVGGQVDLDAILRVAAGASGGGHGSGPRHSLGTTRSSGISAAPGTGAAPDTRAASGTRDALGTGAASGTAGTSATALADASLTDPFPPPARCDVRIGVAQDRAFGFYYADDLDALRSAGAMLVGFDTLNDARLPEVDGLYIGGGFPEMFAAELESNAALRAGIRDAIEAGLPVYAECGGLMYLARTLVRDGRTFRMVGAIPADVVMHARPVGRGYVHLEETAAFPWPRAAAGAPVERAHEFHHSSLENLPDDLVCAYAVRRGHGIDGRRDGIVVRNVLASYAHLRSAGGNAWAARFVDFVRNAGYRRTVGDHLAAPLPEPGREAAVV